MKHLWCVDLRRPGLLLLICLAFLAGFGSPAALAQTAAVPWNEVSEGAIQRSARARTIVPDRYRTLQLDRSVLQALLAATPLEADIPPERSTAILSLPLPEGGYGKFQIAESPIMEPALAARFPEIRTWIGQGISDQTATLRFDLTPTGFHAQIISWQGTIYIDPFQPDDVDNYIVYYKHDYNPDKARMQCAVTGDVIPKDAPNFQKRGVVPKISSGTIRRTYRLAMAATGEYTSFQGGTVALAQAAIVTTMNRVNGIYERDLAVRMNLVANNNFIIYTNPATDPYTNNNGSTMLGENQTNITALIGAGNYDIGHVVSTGGGGIASLGSVCVANFKAQGVTGSSAPIGDAFDVDYVAHEIGHQFGGNHTFNSSESNCGGVNRNTSTAFEPGSGSTIQAYAGICGASNVQPNSDALFHRISLTEALSFVGGAGHTCPTQTPTGNTPPAVSTPAVFNIPISTPFTLTAMR